jgi:hypothetical protein
MNQRIEIEKPSHMNEKLFYLLLDRILNQIVTQIKQNIIKTDGVKI